MLTAIPAEGYIILDAPASVQLKTPEPLVERTWPEFPSATGKVITLPILRVPAVIIPVVVKCDVIGSIDAVISEIKKHNTERIFFKIVHAGTGNVSESDIRMVTSDTDPLIVGFNVDIGIQNQSIFKSFSVGQENGLSTAESLQILNEMANQAGGRQGTTQSVSLYNLYKNRSYACQVSMMGNAMIQPTMYFNLRHVPMFSGPYMIQKVNHTITPGNFETTFEGIRQPTASLPLVENYIQSLKTTLLQTIIQTNNQRRVENTSTGSTKTNVIGQVSDKVNENSQQNVNKPNNTQECPPVKDELIEVKDKYGDERRSQIEYAGGDVSIEDLIADESVVVTISHAGYIKRTSLSEYKTQNRGGVGQKGSATRDQDFLEHLFVATNHQYLMFFTQKGKCFWMRVYEIPEGTKASKGRAIQNIINIEQDDKVKAFICTQDLKDQDYINSHYVIMATKQGQVKKTPLEQYSRPRQNGINAITIKEDDELIGAKLTTGNSQVLLAVKSGKLVRFEEEKTRPMGRTASETPTQTITPTTTITPTEIGRAHV